MAGSTGAKPQEGETSSTTAKGKVVKYIGTADVREIDAAGWKNAKVEDQKKVVWDKSNDWTIPAEDLNEAALIYADKIDDGLVVTDAE